MEIRIQNSESDYPPQVSVRHSVHIGGGVEFCLQEREILHPGGVCIQGEGICIQGEGGCLRGVGGLPPGKRVCIQEGLHQGGGSLHPSRRICIHGEGFCIWRMGSASRMVFIQGGGGLASRRCGLHNPSRYWHLVAVTATVDTYPTEMY